MMWRGPRCTPHSALDIPPVPASLATPTASAVALHISSVDRHRSCSLNTATRYPAAQEEGAELASEHVVVDLGYEARGLRLTKAFLLRKYTDPAASTFTWVSTNIQTQQRQGSRSVSATMARTMKTSHILRAIAKSESQISGDESSCYVSTRSETMESAAESDGIPPAQGSVNSKTSQHEKDDDSDGKPPQEEEPSSSSDSQSSSSSESDNESCEFASGTSGNKLMDEDQVAELLVKFNMRADGNVARIDENSRGQTAVVSLSSEHMRKLYHRFPELVLIDCTHKTNSVMEEFIASTSSTGCAAGDEVKRKKQMTEQDKYKSVQSVFGRITTELTDLPDGKFSDALGQLEQWWGNLRRGTVGIPSSQGATFDSEILSTQVAAPDKTESEDADVTATEGKGADSSPVPVDEPSAVSKSAGDQPESSPKKAAKTTAKSGVSPFNYRAPKLGRPRKDRAAADAKRGAERKEYNNGAKLRTALRGGDVTQVEEFLKSRKPPLVELSSYLNTFETRYRGNNGTKMTVAKRVPEPLCAMYLLPEKIVNTAQMAIEHAIPYGDTMDVSTPPDTSAECWIVDIDGIGVFTQRQLMAMQFILNLSKTCKNGMQCYSWLMSKVDMLFDGEGAASLAERMLNAWPCKDLPGFDLEWSHLYCAREKCWLHDNFIHAFSTTLAAKYNNNATIFLPLLKMPAPDKEKGKRIPPLTLSALSCAEKDMVFMPMNINSSHWTCLVVDHPKQTVYCYDSLAKRVNQKLLSEMAEELVKRCLPQPYTIATVLSPIQKDSDNCGLFICLYFWRRLFKEAGNDYSKTGLLRRRWDVLRAIVNFSDSSKDAK
ncbi:hypothetical protein PF003_g9688 [Phytophthora fragariae]|nr:hypothetical protein PF003_g9688 [Phytophthora fragariae]